VRVESLDQTALFTTLASAPSQFLRLKP